MSHFPEFPGYLNVLKQKSLVRVEKNRKKIKKLTKEPNKSFASFALALIELDEKLSFCTQPIFHLNGVKNSIKTQKAVKELLPVLSDYHTELAQNEKIYAALKAIEATEKRTLTKEEQMALKLEIQGFELEGVALGKEQKKRIAVINEELSGYENDFSQNVLDDTNAFEMIVDEAAVAEMPTFEKNSAKVEGGYKFTLQGPSFISFMTYGADRTKREELYRGYVTRGEKNAELITKILTLRDEKAKLLGFDSFASLSLATKMAGSCGEVLKFLQDLAVKSKASGEKEIEDLRAFASKYGVNDLQSYDVAYFSEKLRKEAFDIDEEYFKEYFELNSVLKGMFEFLGKMFGIKFEAVEADLWHKSAKTYDIYEDSVVIGRLYMDLSARKDKKGGAWMDNWENAHIDDKGKKSLPVAFVVCNFPKQTKKEPSLLRHNDIETLFHEMGHALHHLLAKNSVASVSGVNGVMWDVVEFPSQFLENFAYSKEVLKLFSFHYKTKEALKDEDIDKLQTARNFQSAMAMLRQLEFGIFDMKTHSTLTDESGAERILEEVRAETSVMTPPSYNKLKNSFSHIFAGGYAAGYYSYKWAEVLSADAFYAFEGKDGTLDYSKGAKIRETLFAKGGAEDMREIFREFMGRDADATALLRLCGIV